MLALGVTLKFVAALDLTVGRLPTVFALGTALHLVGAFDLAVGRLPAVLLGNRLAFVNSAVLFARLESSSSTHQSHASPCSHIEPDRPVSPSSVPGESA